MPREMADVALVIFAMAEHYNINLIAEMEQKTSVVIDDRVEAASRKVVNRHSILRAGLRKRRFR